MCCFLEPLDLQLQQVLMYSSGSQGQQFIDQKNIEGSTLQCIQELHHPFNKIVRIEVTVKGGKRWIGSGCLVEQALVLTCLHNLVNNDRVVKAEEITVYVGQNGPINIDDKYEVLGFKYNKDYFDKGKFNKLPRKQKAYDYAMLLLKPTSKQMIEQNNKLSILIPQPLDQFGNKKVHKFQLYGYDSGYNRRYNQQHHKENESRLFGCQTDMLDMTQNFIDYKVSTEPGKSGAPLISYCKMGLFKIIGIHLASSGEKEYNFALRINESVVKNLRKWMDEWQKGDQILSPLISKLHIHKQEDLGKKTNKNSIFQGRNQKSKDQSSTLLNSIKRMWIRFAQTLRIIEEKGSENCQKDNEICYDKNVDLSKIKQSKQIDYFQVPKNIKNNSISYSKQNQKIIQHKNFHSELQHIKTLKTKTQIEKYIKSQSKQLQKLSYSNGTIDLNLIPQFFQDLKHITLNNCNINTVPSLRALRKLQFIDCSANFIVQISNFLTNVVIYLNLNENCIKEVPESIIGASSLRQLSLSTFGMSRPQREIIKNPSKHPKDKITKAVRTYYLSYSDGTNGLYLDYLTFNKIVDSSIDVYQDSL